MYVIIILIFGVIVFLSLLIFCFVNKLYVYKEKIEVDFVSVRAYIEERVSLFEDMSSFLLRYVSHEEELFQWIESDLKSLRKISTLSDGIYGLKNTFLVFDKFFVLDKTYDFLKKNKEYTTFFDEYKKHMDRVNYTMEHYDNLVKEYNHYRENRVIAFISNLLKFPDYDYYNK